MAVRRNLCLRLALLLAIAVQTVYAAPASSTARLRAAYCCATHCSHRQGARGSDRCCQVTSQATYAAVPVSPLAPDPPLAVHSLSPRGADPVSSISSATGVELGSHGPPLFLKVRSLRL